TCPPGDPLCDTATPPSEPDVVGSGPYPLSRAHTRSHRLRGSPPRVYLDGTGCVRRRCGSLFSRGGTTDEHGATSGIDRRRAGFGSTSTRAADGGASSAQGAQGAREGGARRGPA